MSEFPEHMQINPATQVNIAIPSWHINGHGERCQKGFCLGYTRGAGRTCGEEIKTTWSFTNSLVPSVREMAQGARHDTLKIYWNGWNFHKIVGFHIFHSVILFDHQISLWLFLKKVPCLQSISRKQFWWVLSIWRSSRSSLQHSHRKLLHDGYGWLNTGKPTQRHQIHIMNQHKVSGFLCICSKPCLTYLQLPPCRLSSSI